MSQENVEVCRRAYEAFNRGDSEGMVADFAEEFEYVSTGALPDARGVYRGPKGWTDFVGWLRSEFESPRVEINELTEGRGDQVLASVTLRGRGKQSGVEASWDVWHLWTVENGKVVHGHGFTSKTEALEAAGLRE
jgi:ketosteroid isomerase-like protein